MLKDQMEKSCIIEKEKTQRMSAALLQTEADNRDLSLRYQQLELKLTHTEAELDTLKRSEKDRSLQLQVCRARALFSRFAHLPPLAQRALADVQQLGNTVQEQLAAIQQLEAANKKLSSEAEVAFARTEKMQQNESMMELLQQALAGLQEDRRSMQVTCDVWHFSV